ncbi:MAG: divalent-cation tolerance protein CutA [Candidatus Altiarchaeales archaeon]|nr:MAG: divalent-cation tolerance protein CutA [Candidatus Altiarchaeales archaeon]
MILIYITCREKSEARRISEHLLKKRLIACANIFPIESMYWWKDKINEEREFVVIAKTLEEKFDEIRGEIKKVHSYEVPCILKIEVEADEGFLEWVEGEVEDARR